MSFPSLYGFFFFFFIFNWKVPCILFVNIVCLSVSLLCVIDTYISNSSLHSSSCIRQVQLHPVFFLILGGVGCSARLAGSQFPGQGLNLDPCRESTRPRLTTDHQVIPTSGFLSTAFISFHLLEGFSPRAFCPASVEWSQFLGLLHNSEILNSGFSTIPGIPFACLSRRVPRGHVMHFPSLSLCLVDPEKGFL